MSVTAFIKLCESFWKIIKPEGWFWESPFKMQVVLEVRAVLGAVPSKCVIGLNSCTHHDLWHGKLTSNGRLGSIFVWRLTTVNGKPRQRIERKRRDKLAFTPAFLSQEDCLRAAVSLFDRRSPFFLRQKALHASFTLFLSRNWETLPSLPSGQKRKMWEWRRVTAVLMMLALDSWTTFPGYFPTAHPNFHNRSFFWFFLN